MKTQPDPYQKLKFRITMVACLYFAFMLLVLHVGGE